MLRSSRLEAKSGEDMSSKMTKVTKPLMKLTKSRPSGKASVILDNMKVETGSGSLHMISKTEVYLTKSSWQL